MNNNDKRDVLRYAARHLRWLAGDRDGQLRENVNGEACVWAAKYLDDDAKEFNSEPERVGIEQERQPVASAPTMPNNWLGGEGMAPILKLDNEKHADVGAVTKAHYDEITGNTWRTAFSNGSAVGIDTIDGRKALKLKLNRTTGAGTNGTGKVAGRIPLKPSEYVRTRALVFFPEGFDFGGVAMTGKIGAGIFFGDEMSSGLNLKTGGGSFRSCYGHLSRRDREARPRPYLYRQDQAQAYGDGKAVPNVRVERGQWIEIILEGVAQTSVNTTDGEARMWWNGKLVYNDTAVPWVRSGNRLATQIIWDFFQGGSNTRNEPELYSPESDQHMYVAEMAYTTTR